jgi:hypothetical protein
VILEDSLPALQELHDLEALAVAPAPGGRANAARTVWHAPQADSLVVAFHTERRRHDSTVLFLWSSAGGAHRRVVRARGPHRWSLPRRGADRDASPAGWEEVIAAYVARPRFPPLRSDDAGLSGVTPFERVTGRVLHLVNGVYRNRRVPVVRPDTGYPAPSRGELELLARGDALAVVNPGPDALQLGIIIMRDGRRRVCRVPGRTVHVYRTLLRRADGPVLAHTDPGAPRPLFAGDTPAVFFWLDERKTP